MYQIKTKKFSTYLSNSPAGDNVIKEISKFLQISPNNVLDGLHPGLVISWGILRGSDKIIKECIRKNRNFLYIDHAYFNGGHKGDQSYYRIVKNELQLTQINSCLDDRYKKLNIPLKPWRKDGDYILICPPSKATTNFYDLTYDWLEKTLTILDQITDIPVIVRYKPGEVDIDFSKGYSVPKGIIRREQNLLSLDEQLSRAYAVVTFNSSVAVKAITEGIPVVVDTISAAAPISRTSLLDIENLLYPDREECISSLSYGQFSWDEISTGKFFELLEL